MIAFLIYFWISTFLFKRIHDLFSNKFSN